MKLLRNLNPKELIRSARPTIRNLATAAALCVLSAIPVLAQDEENQPMDPTAKAEQLWMFGIIAGLLLLFLLWYLIRRWQTIRSGRVIEGVEQDDEWSSRS
ncbi:MAG TPA: hypothetical protein VGS41_09790 [Chthonomonadales bacterium]|nr:hypothetical protein [Chthonomonadales bacterium]